LVQVKYLYALACAVGGQRGITATSAGEKQHGLLVSCHNGCHWVLVKV
jgi:hypothetical protein